MKKILISAILLVGVMAMSGVASAVTNATAASVRVYKVFLSTDPLCVAPFQTIDLGSAGVAVDMVAGGSFGAVTTVAVGTYKCVIMQMSDQVTFTPLATDGACTAGTSATIDVCADHGGGFPTTQNPETGAISTCTASTDTIFTYISTLATTTTGSQTNNPLLPPTAALPADTGFKLNNDVVFSAAGTGVFTFNTVGKVDGVTNGTCDLLPPDFGFHM